MAAYEESRIILESSSGQVHPCLCVLGDMTGVEVFSKDWTSSDWDIKVVRPLNELEPTYTYCIET